MNTFSNKVSEEILLERTFNCNLTEILNDIISETISIEYSNDGFTNPKICNIEELSEKFINILKLTNADINIDLNEALEIQKITNRKVNNLIKSIDLYKTYNDDDFIIVMENKINRLDENELFILNIELDSNSTPRMSLLKNMVNNKVSMFK